MHYKLLGKTGLRVSEIALGGMTFGRETDKNETFRVLDTFIAAGGNFVDTADIYNQGISETFIGEWLTLHPGRDDYVIATKVLGRMGKNPNDTGLSAKHLLSACEHSLRRLGTDYIDLYQIHGGDWDTPWEETLQTLDRLVQRGWVRYIGCSNLAAWQLMKALSVSEQNRWQRFVTLQPQYSLVHREVDRELLPLCRAEGVGVIPWSPLGGGFLTGRFHAQTPPPANTRIAGANPEMEESLAHRATDANWRTLDVVETIAHRRGKTIAQVSLRWLMQKEGITAPIVGVRNHMQLQENLGAVGWELTDEEWQELDTISRLPLTYPHTWAYRHEGRNRM